MGKTEIFVFRTAYGSSNCSTVLPVCWREVEQFIREDPKFPVIFSIEKSLRPVIFSIDIDIHPVIFFTKKSICHVISFIKKSIRQ